MKRSDGGVTRKNERGIALIIALFALLLLSAIAMGMMYMADTEMSVNNNYRDAQQVFYASQAGLQEARLRLLNDSSGGTPMGAAMPAVTPVNMPAAGNATGATYILNPLGAQVIQPWNQAAGNAFRDDEFCKEQYAITGGAANIGAAGVPCGIVAGNYPNGVWYSAVAASNLGAAGNNYFKWVRITLKENNSSAPFPVDGAQPATTPVCWDGYREVTKPGAYATCNDNPPPAPATTFMRSVFTATSLAVGPTGSRRMTQMDMALDPPFITNAAFDTNDFVNTSGSSLTINGFDNCACSCATAKGKAVPTCTNRNTGAACTGNTYAIFTTKTITSSGSPAIIAGTNPAAAQNQSFAYDVASLISDYSTQPGAVNVTGPPYNQACTPSLPGPPVVAGNCGTFNGTAFGTAPNPFPPANVNNPAGEVRQITYFPGSVDLQAHSSGAGILIVDGDLTVHGGIDFYGLILVKGVLTFAGGGAGQGNNIIGGVVAGNGGVADSLGGSINMQFDSCALNQQRLIRPPNVISFREVMY